MKIYEARAIPGEGVVVQEFDGKVCRALVARVDSPNVVLEHVHDVAAFNICCVVEVRRKGVSLDGYVTPTFIDRENGILHLAGFPVMAGDVLEVAALAAELHARQGEGPAL